VYRRGIAAQRHLGIGTRSCRQTVRTDRPLALSGRAASGSPDQGGNAGEVNAWNGIGHVHRQQGRHEQAIHHYQPLLHLTQEAGDRNFEFEAWQGLGRLRHDTGHPDAAIAHHQRALTLAGELRQPDDQARAHDGLAHAHHALKQHQLARKHWQHALDILTSLGLDHTEEEETTATAIHAYLSAFA
jgi:tetratricopeptide (TPR) repeat protein